MSAGASAGPLTQAQRQRLARFKSTSSVDIHCHCLPDLDDGPTTMAQAVALCRELVDDGITEVCATPHLLGRFCEPGRADTIRQRAAELREALTAEQIPLAVHAGADIRIDERLPRLLQANELLTLGERSRWVLLELPHEAWVDASAILHRLTAGGYSAIISHPERYPYLADRLDAVWSWLEAGAVLQVTCGSILGDFGAGAEEVAWHLLQLGWIDLAASDAHDAVKRPPRMTAAIDAIASRLGYAVARRLCIENPAAIVAGRALNIPRRSLPRRQQAGWFQRLRAGLTGQRGARRSP